MTMKTSKISMKRGPSPIGSNTCTSASSSSCARTVADIGDHDLPILSVVSSPDEPIVGRFFPCYEVIQTVCVFCALSSFAFGTTNLSTPNLLFQSISSDYMPEKLKLSFLMVLSRNLLYPVISITP